MNTTTATAPKFRKTKQGEWVVFGPASVVRAGWVGVRKANGETKNVVIERTGREFAVDGETMVYGYVMDHADAKMQGYYDSPRSAGHNPWNDVSTPRGTRPSRKQDWTAQYDM